MATMTFKAPPLLPGVYFTHPPNPQAKTPIKSEGILSLVSKKLFMPLHAPVHPTTGFQEALYTNGFDLTLSKYPIMKAANAETLMYERFRTDPILPHSATSAYSSDCDR